MRKYFHIRKPTQTKAKLQILDQPVRPIAETGLTALIGLTGQETGMTARTDDDTNSAKKDGSIIKIEDLDWRVPIIAYLKDRGRGAERNIRHIAFIYVLIYDGYYH